jgi:hypothetical protein
MLVVCEQDTSSRWLHIPLEMLLMPVLPATKTRGRRFCIQRGTSINECVSVLSCVFSALHCRVVRVRLSLAWKVSVLLC